MAVNQRGSVYRIMNIPLTPLRFLRYAEQQYPNETAVVCGDLRFTYAQFADRANRLAGVIHSAGLTPGARVAFLSTNCHRFLEAYYGVVAAGAVLLPLNHRLSADELAYVLKDSEATILFLQQEFLPLVESLRARLSSVRTFFLLDGTPSAGWLSPRNYDHALADASPYVPDIMAIDEDSVAELFYTSGTGAMPKGVMLTHRNVYLHAVDTFLALDTHGNRVGLHTIPLFHANGWGAAHTLTAIGGKHVMLHRFIPNDVFQLVEREGVQTLHLVPIMALALVNSPDRQKYDLSCLEWVSIGGAASSPTLLREVEEKIGCDCFSGYGLTETAPVLSTAKLKPGRKLQGEQRHVAQAMTGYAIPGVEIRVVDVNDRDVPRDGKTMGEVIARGDGVMLGYWRQPQATAEVMRNGWFHTGDMAVMHEDGSFLIVDRKKDIIISGGENISSLEVEKAIYAHPAVYEVAVIPVPDEQWGEVPKALVVLKPGSMVTEAELIDFCRGRLSHYKCPHSVEFVESLPKTATGKVLKKSLRQKFRAKDAPTEVVRRD
jgi:fatty-acyl-CoA synthase